MESNFKFIILGAGRGGTTLLMSLLDYHSKIKMLSEYNSVKFLLGQGFKHENYENIITYRSEKFIASCTQKATEHPTKIFGNKITTEQLNGLEIHNTKNIHKQVNILNEFFQKHLVNQKTIFILRDGRNCTTSKVRRSKLGINMEQACKNWNYSVDVYKYLKNEKNSLCIKFEDLINTPILTLMEITKFLEVSFELNMLNGVSSDKLQLEYQYNNFVKEKTIPTKMEKRYFSLIEENLNYCGYT